MRRPGLLLTSILLVSLSIVAGQKRVKKARVNHPPQISSFSSSTRSVSLCPFYPCAPAGAEIARLTLVATDADRDALQFECAVLVGKLSACGPTMSWDLNNVLRGTHTIAVKVRDGQGGEATANLAITVQDCGVCDPPPPPCPTIEVSCPTQINNPKIVKCQVTISGSAEPYKPPSFKWSVQWGKIVKGQNTREIEVEPTDLDEEIRATVEVGSYDPSCSTTASCSVKIKQPLP